jgi:flagellin
MRIQHNIMAMSAYRNYTNNTTALSKNLEKLSSGYKINRAGDDAAGLAISEKMRAQITGLKTAQKNVKDGISLVKTAEGATQEIHDMLNRMVDLATQSANGTYQDKVDREAITNEFEQLKSEINRIADSANFNGIKLLDGSLDAKAAETKVDIIGVNSTKSLGSKAKFEMNAAFTTMANAAEDGQTLEFNVGFDDGTSTTVKFTVDATKKVLVAEDGTEYTIAGDLKATDAQMSDAVLKELNKTKLSDEFTMTATGNKIAFEAKDVGTGGRQIKSMDYILQKKDGTQTDAKDVGVKVTAGKDDGREITAADIIEYNGKNYDDAVFTINGKKFVLLTETHDGSALNDPTLTDNTEAMHAALGLGNDVTILVGGTAGLTAADDNFAQNIKAIENATGLTVTDAITETGGNTGTAAGAGIRLSAGKGNGKNGLTLQIGDDSEDYNQLKVSIGDMHTKALGLDKISLGTQKGAQDAVTAIKDAINYVSQVRGTLGATQNRLEHTQNNLSVMQENIQDAESTIRDTDVAEEMMAYTKNNILVQSAQAMLAQANQVPQGVLQLLG